MNFRLRLDIHVFQMKGFDYSYSMRIAGNLGLLVSICNLTSSLGAKELYMMDFKQVFNRSDWIAVIQGSQ